MFSYTENDHTAFEGGRVDQACRHIILRRTLMGKRAIIAALFAFTIMLFPVVDDAEARGPSRLQQEQLEIGRAMLEVQNVE